MKPYVVQRGDYLTALAFRFGFDAAEVWDHPKNEELRSVRSSPDILCPGDLLWIPNKPAPAKAVASAASNPYVANVPSVTVNVALSDGKGPCASEPCLVDGANPTPPAKVDDAGVLSFDVPVTTREVTVVLPNRLLAFRVQIGALSPEGVTRGAKTRLAQLGYCSAVDVDSWDERASLAMRNFQMDHHLTVDGTLNEETTLALKQAHGS